MSEIKNGGLDQYGAEPFEQQQFRTAGTEGVNHVDDIVCFLYWLLTDVVFDGRPFRSLCEF